MSLSATLEQTKSTFPWRLLFLALAIALHWATLRAPVEWPRFSPSPRVEVIPIDPAKLQALKDSIRKKSLLLNPGKESSDAKPDDARYFSDRNIRVEKETKARVADAVPKPGTPGAGGSARSAAPAKPRASSPAVPLSRLGIAWSKKPEPAQAAAPSAPSETRAGSGMPQSLDDRTIPESSDNLLNAEESTYYSFYARIYEAIAPVWQSKIRSSSPERRLAKGDYRTLIDVVLDDEGTLLEIRMLQSSGVVAFDQAADLSWKNVPRFPNPPKGLLSRDGKIHIGYSFTVQVDQEWGVKFLPPEQNS